MSASTPHPAGAAAGPASLGVLGELESLLAQRRRSAPESSYSAQLVADPERVARKVVEEAYEVAVELQRRELDAERVAAEAADLVFHLLAGLVGAGVALEDVLAELAARRRGTR